jgi:putative MFS transporter
LQHIQGWVAMNQSLPLLTGTTAATREHNIAKVTIGTLFSADYRRRTTMLWLLWFFWSFSHFGVLLWLPSLLLQHRGVPGVQVFSFMMGFLITGMCGRAAILILVDTWGRRNSIALVSVVSTIMLIIFSQQTGYNNLLIFGYLFAFFTMPA